MIRVAISAVLFFVAFFIETSFISSLPSIFSTIPIVFGLSVYLIQNQNIYDGIGWMIGYGFLIDLMNMNDIPFYTISTAIATLIAVTTARHIFSNRSFYGVMTCSLSSYAALVIVESFMTSFEWPIFLQMHFERLVMLMIIVGILFYTAPKIFVFLKTSTNVSQRF